MLNSSHSVSKFEQRNIIFKMCYFFATYCLKCNNLGKSYLYEDCNNKKNCRKELFEVEPGYFYYEHCLKCSKKLNVLMTPCFYVPF